MQSYLKKEGIVPGLPGVILLSHGQLALGLRDAAEIVYGESANLAVFWLERGDDLDAFQEAFAQAYTAYKECPVIVDMNGFYDIIANHIFERVINRQVLETEEFKTWLAKAKKDMGI